MSNSTKGGAALTSMALNGRDQLYLAGEQRGQVRLCRYR
jgi:hypothetical protein